MIKEIKIKLNLIMDRVRMILQYKSFQSFKKVQYYKGDFWKVFKMKKMKCLAEKFLKNQVVIHKHFHLLFKVRKIFVMHK